MTTPAITLELQLQRRLTKEFIAWDPSTIVLIPQVRERTGSGGTDWIDGEPREPQVFKLITMSDSTRPVRSADGVERIVDFTLLGEWDCEMQIYDYWLDSNGARYEIIEIVPHNGYEVKGLVTRRGFQS
jgi:hypothetical protein